MQDWIFVLQTLGQLVKPEWDIRIPDYVRALYICVYIIYIYIPVKFFSRYEIILK